MATVGLHFILNVIEADRTLILLTVPSSRLDFMNYMHVTLGVNFIFINRQGNFWYLSWFHEVNSHFPSPQDGQFVLVSQTLITKSQHIKHHEQRKTLLLLINKPHHVVSKKNESDHTGECDENDLFTNTFDTKQRH
jgi:hypothetical protein